MTLNALKAGNTALITGGAAGIGLATARRLAAQGLSLILVDLREDLFAAVQADLKAAGAPEVWTISIDVSDRAAIELLRDQVITRFGRIDLLMCNAGIGPASDIFDTEETWQRIVDVNLWGVIHFCQVFVPGMIASGGPALVINTGSKQGITTPPGNPAYNLSKAGVKTFTESLQHHLRGTGADISAHLLIPGFVFTDLTRGALTDKPAGAWTADQTADFMFDRLAAGDFYILCPDNEVTRELDEKRMAWAMGDIIENRPPLSRWHEDWGASFQAFLDKDS